MRRIFSSKLVLSFLTIAFVCMFATAVAAQTTTEVVNGDTAAGENILADPGFKFARDLCCDTPYDFTDDQQSIGNGSLFVLPLGSAPGDKFIGELFLYEQLANIDTISVDYKFATGSVVNPDHVYFVAYVNGPDSLPTKFYDCRNKLAIYVRWPM
mgnify:CR=1 FL=1